MVNAKPPRNFGFKLRHNNLLTSVYRWHLYLELGAHYHSHTRRTEHKESDFFPLHCSRIGILYYFFLVCVSFIFVPNELICV